MEIHWGRWDLVGEDCLLKRDFNCSGPIGLGGCHLSPFVLTRKLNDETTPSYYWSRPIMQTSDDG